MILVRSQSAHVGSNIRGSVVSSSGGRPTGRRSGGGATRATVNHYDEARYIGAQVVRELLTAEEYEKLLKRIQVGEND